MNPPVILAKRVASLLMLSLLVSLGCATPSKQMPTTVGPQCNISWDQVNDPNVTGYQLTVIDQSSQAEKTVQLTPAGTTKVSCRDAGAGHEELWDVTVQSCYDTSSCSARLKPHASTSQPSNRDRRHRPSIPAECFLLAKRVSFDTEGRVNTTRQYQEYRWSGRLKERELYTRSHNITLQ
ncbi:MAG: hypothetical protein ABIQ79_07380 [Nitrospiraceae bacterium]